SWQCEAWYLSPTGEVYKRVSASAISVPTTDLSGWTRLAAGVVLPQTLVSPMVTVPEGSSVELKINFQIDAGADNEPVRFATAIANRAQNPGDALICF